MLHFLLPEVFNDLDSFQNWFNFSSVLDESGQKDLIEKRKRKLVSTMHAILKPFLLRRVKTDVESEMPRKREYILYAPLTPEQKELYLAVIHGSGRQYLEGKAVERIESKNGSSNPSRSQSLKRRANGSGVSTPNKSLKSSRDSTPGAGLPSRRRKGRKSMKEMSDKEFNAKLRNLEKGIEDDEIEEDEPSEGELEEIEKAKTMALASMDSHFCVLPHLVGMLINTQQERKFLRRSFKTPLCKPVWRATLHITSTGLGTTTQASIPR